MNGTLFSCNREQAQAAQEGEKGNEFAEARVPCQNDWHHLTRTLHSAVIECGVISMLLVRPISSTAEVPLVDTTVFIFGMGFVVT